MNEKIGPLLTLHVHQALLAAQAAGREEIQCSLDLGRSKGPVLVGSAGWVSRGRLFPFLDVCKDRTVYHWTGQDFAVVSRFNGGLIKLVPTEWGPPTFEIDGIKMLPTAHVSPYADAERKVGLIAPRGKRVLDTCGGLGYFAAWCLQGGAQEVISFEKNPDVIWLRSLNPWSPAHGPGSALTLRHGDVAEQIATLPAASVDAILHDPPRFGIAGELYSQVFYNHLARVIRPRGRLFHYTGTPNKLTSKRDVPNEVSKRLQLAGFSTELNGDGVVGVRVSNR
ncbi:MAG: SAM-dependent methyltransferase [Pseudomonadota bacterium]